MDEIARAVASYRVSRIAPSIRLAYVIFRLSADIESGFGKAILDILKQQYPGSEKEMEADGVVPSKVGGKLLAIARKELQYNDVEAMDAAQDLLTYIATGSQYETDESGQVVRAPSESDPEKSVPKKREKAKPFDFTKGSKTWKEALGNIYSNMRTTAMSRSMGKFKKKETETGISEAFGRRTDEGKYEGAEERVPDIDDDNISKALDDRASVKSFMDAMDEYIPSLKASLSEDTKRLFDMIFYYEIGGFGSDIKENMGQASSLKDMVLGEGQFKDKKYEKHWEPSVYESNQKRWSGYVGDLRKRLLQEIHTFIEKKLPKVGYEKLYEFFFSDTTPREVEKLEEGKAKEREDYQRGIDERKIADFKWIEEQGHKLSDKDQKSYDNLKKKFKKQDINLDEVEAKKPDAKKLKRLGIPDTASDLSKIASRIAFAA